MTHVFQIFAALAFPIEDNSDVFISYQLQANYALPENETDYQYPPIITDDSRRSFHFTRKRIYQYFEEELSS